MFKKSMLALALTASAGMVHAAGEIDIQGTFAGGAFASNVDVAGTVTGAVTLETLLGTVARTVDMEDALALVATRSIVYSPNTNISQNSTITFQVTNGAILAPANGAPALAALYDQNAAAVVGNLIDFTTDADGNYTTMRFQIVNADLVSTDGYNIGYVNGDDAIVRTNAGLTAGQSVSIAATSAQDPSAIAIAQGVAPAENVVTVIAGLASTVTVATSVIDVEATPSRTAFVFEGALTDTPATVSSVATITTTNTAEITFDLTAASYELSVTRGDTANVTGSVFDGGALEATRVHTGVDADADLLGARTLELSVNGTGVLATGDWTANLVLDTAELTTNTTLLNAATSHQWSINGAQVKIPYHAQNATGFNFFFNAVNESANDAALAADVIVQNTTAGTSCSVDGVALGTAASESSFTVGQAAIKAAINAEGTCAIDDSSIYHVAMTVTAIAPTNQVQFAAFQKDAVGRTVVPVYVNTDGNLRTWVQ